MAISALEVNKFPSVTIVALLVPIKCAFCIPIKTKNNPKPEISAYLKLSDIASLIFIFDNANRNTSNEATNTAANAAPNEIPSPSITLKRKYALIPMPLARANGLLVNKPMIIEEIPAEMAVAMKIA